MEDSQRILDAIRRLVRLLRLSDRAAQGSVGLSAAQLFVLSELGKTPALSVGELAERTRTDQSSVSTVVARLVDAGLVERERAPDDARRLVLNLTRAGKAALRKAPPIAQEVLLASIDRLTGADRKRLADLFGSVVDAMGPGESVPMFFEDEPRKNKSRKKKND